MSNQNEKMNVYCLIFLSRLHILLLPSSVSASLLPPEASCFSATISAITALNQGSRVRTISALPAMGDMGIQDISQALWWCGSQLFAHVLQGSASGRCALGNPQPPLIEYRYPSLRKQVNHAIFPSFLPFLQLASKPLFSYWLLWLIWLFFSAMVTLWESVVAEGASPTD